MANIIPPLVSDSPPPPPSEDEEDDEFDDFRESNDLSYGCDSFSITSSPEQSPKKVFKEEPSSKHNSELHFDSGTPKAIITNSKEEIQIDDSKAKENDVYFLEENIKELSISETSSTSNHILFKNNFVNKDLDVHFKENIPSQLILENKICDNSDIINDINPVVLNDDTSKKFNLLNNHTESTTQQDSIDVSQNIENNFNLKSTNIENIQGNTSLYETSKNGDGVTTDVCSNSINNDEVFEKFLLNKKHSKTVPIVENPNLVKENKKHSTVNLDNDNSESNSENEAFKSDLNFKNEDSHSASFECDFNNSEIECCSNKELGNTFNSNTNDSPNNSSEIIGDSPLDIANKKLNNNTDDFENFTMFVSANEEMPDSNSDFKECVKNNLETTTTTTDDEFANFATFFPTAEEKEDDSSKESSNEVGDFAEFVPLSVQSNLSGTTEKAEDNFATSSSLKSGPFNLDESDDEFGDFGDFTSSSFDSQNQQASSVPTSKTNYPLLNQQEAFKKAQEIIKDMFDPVEEDLNGFQYVELVKEDFIFNQIQDITDTAALSYHWSKSASQKMLLKSLNIDSRNILYSGHSWNPSMPRFAANLGVQPLEPVKMEPSTTSTAPVAQANFQSEIETQDIPKAEFDWTNSGLVNPLDYKTNSNIEATKKIESVELQDDKYTENEDDDFTEFHSSVPLPQSKPPIAMPVLQPLKPTVVYSNAPSSQINWPDPGITDDDIRKFEEAFATPIVLQNPEKPKKEPNVEVNVSNANAASSHLKKTANVAPRTEFPMWDTSPVHQLHKKLESKKVDVRLTPTTADEDEWSEFVSVAKPSPVHRAKQSDRNQTSSPDLTLSVLNLGSIQPAKQPIPVITPQGLVQTRLSSNTNTTSHHKSNFIIPKQLPQSQPSIISNQFASQAYNFSKNFTQSSTQLPNQKSSQTIGILGAKAQEDDEWGEFVSSPLPPHLKNSNTTVNHSWNNFVLNPGQEIKRANSVVQKKNGNQVPSLVLPELDFLALKEQTGVHKKK